MGALFPVGVRPVGSTANKVMFSEIVNHNTKHNNVDIHRVSNNIVVDPRPIDLTIDSGACDAVCPPSAFPNTNVDNSNRECGKQCGACGGEAVRNIGCKHFKCLTGEGHKHAYNFHIGDNTTKPLLAVSKMCEQKQGVFCGPAPAYKSFIVDDPDAFVVHN